MTSHECMHEYKMDKMQCIGEWNPTEMREWQLASYKNATDNCHQKRRSCLFIITNHCSQCPTIVSRHFCTSLLNSNCVTHMQL